MNVCLGVTDMLSERIDQHFNFLWGTIMRNTCVKSENKPYYPVKLNMPIYIYSASIIE